MTDGLKIFNLFCEILDAIGDEYKKNEENLTITTVNCDEDLPVAVKITVDEENELVKLRAFFPARFCKKNLTLGALAVCFANDKNIDGCFEYNISTGKIYFRCVNSYKNCKISWGLLEGMLRHAQEAVRDNNDDFAKLDSGELSPEEYFGVD